jgi:hypothetical protein
MPAGCTFHWMSDYGLSLSEKPTRLRIDPTPNGELDG